jgi:hypothetical protein
MIFPALGLRRHKAMARVKYMTKDEAARYHLCDYPNFGPNGSVAGMKKLYYGKDALLVRSGAYVYHVPAEIYNQAH